MKPRALAALALALLAAGPLRAEPAAVQRQVLQRSPGPGEAQEVLLVKVEIAPGASTGRHSHPGVETGYVVEGEVVMQVEGEAPRRLVPGDSYLVPAGRIHDVRAVGERPARALATFVVERGKPLAIPVAP
ncbi:MAG: cupin domain-containing protein [Burkholderiales bacterium]|nr:cupin domain-containing protein [Burkholderiales bacterium]